MQRRVLFNTATNYVAKILFLATGFVLTPFLLRHLGQTTYGLWVLVNSVVTYGGLLDLGIGAAVIKFMAEYRARG